jgi:bifunctional DNA-binding transcriptional regulator/antitoxin component of YhaV-PrlF toxin-antitoxin module
MQKNPLKTKPIVRLRRKMQVTIPTKIVKALKLDEGSFLEISILHDQILLAPIRTANRKPRFEREYLITLSRTRS